MEYTLFAVTAPGVEGITAREVRALTPHPQPLPPLPTHFVGRGGRGEAGGIEYKGSLRDLYRANLHLRTVNRMLVRLGEFYAAAFSELRKKASRLPWGNFLVPGQPVTLRVTCHKSRLYHSEAVAERVAGAIEDRLGKAASHVKGQEADEASSSAQMIVVRLMRDKCTISVDSSGALLHQRGYRLATAKAPLRETLAAAIVLASGWDLTSPLLDPFCGSGTIPIEAALMAMGIPPGRSRRFAFMDWPSFDAALWESVLAESSSLSPTPWPPILASDRDAGAIEAARANAARAGVANAIEFSCRAVSAIEPPPRSGWLVTNPPYGVRLGEEKALVEFYPKLGDVLKKQFTGWRAYLLSADMRLPKLIHLAVSKRTPLFNGALECRLFEYKMVQGEMRKKKVDALSDLT